MKTLLLLIVMIFTVSGSNVIMHMYNDSVEKNTPYCYMSNDSTVIVITYTIDGQKPRIILCTKAWQYRNELHIFAPWFVGITIVCGINYYNIREISKKLVKKKNVILNNKILGEETQ